MTTAARISKGAKLFMGTANALVEISEILDINEPGFEKELENVTSHDSGDAEEYIAGGTYDTTEMTYELHYIAGSANDTSLLAAALAVGPGAIRYFKTQPKAATGTHDRTFAGFVTRYTPGSKGTKGKQTCSVTIKPTGAITQGATA